MVKILTICPYYDYMLKALVQIQAAGLAEFINVGSKNKIIEICYINNINYHELNIIDVSNEMDICFTANDILKEDEDIIGIIFGDFPKGFQKNIVTINSDMNIVDVPKTSHLLIVPRYLNEEFIGYEEKKQAILAARDLLNTYNIKHQKIAFVAGQINSTLNIEKNIIEMDDESACIDIINIKEVFKKGYNVLIFNNTDAVNIFIDTLQMIDKSKYANIKKASKHYVIDASELKFKNLFFSIFMISKISFYPETS